MYTKFNQQAPTNNPTIEGNVYTTAPQEIGKINYIYFYPDHIDSPVISLIRMEL